MTEAQLASVSLLVKHGLEPLVFLPCKVSAVTMLSRSEILLTYIMLRVLCGKSKHGAFRHVYTHTQTHYKNKQTKLKNTGLPNKYLQRNITVVRKESKKESYLLKPRLLRITHNKFSSKRNDKSLLYFEK